MRRQDIQLRALARQGDCAAKLKVGEVYLTGAHGTARNIRVGLDYVAAAAQERPVEAAKLVGSLLSLDEIIEFDQFEMLRTAAAHCESSQIKCAIWALLLGSEREAAAFLEQARPGSTSIEMAWRKGPPGQALASVLRHAQRLQAFDMREVLLAAASRARDAHDLPLLVRIVTAALHLDGRADLTFAGFIVDAVHMSEKSGQNLGELEIANIHASLDKLSLQGDVAACYLLGRALCGIDCSRLPWSRLVPSTNLRKGSALLLRAADGGVVDAWLHLYRVSSDYRCSAANAQIARFCLEKAARHGEPEAQRRLGALQMREAETLADAERAVELLFAANQSGDGHARALLHSLVLPLRGPDVEALAVIEEVQAIDAWLATRLRLARHFGLTKLEALSVDPCAGARPWGLVVGHNPFVSQARLSAPRAVPATTPEGLIALHKAATLFAAKDQNSEGNLRKRSASQRRLFQQMRLDEAMFFSSANSAEREALRIGSRWAHRCRTTLQLALGDQLI